MILAAFAVGWAVEAPVVAILEARRRPRDYSGYHCPRVLSSQVY